MQEIVLFILSYISILLIYEVVIVMPAKNRHQKKTKKKEIKEPVEIKYLITRYKLDLKKVNYNQLLQIVALTSSFDISLIVSLMMLVNNFFIRIVIGIVTMIVSILISYHFVYLFYKKKGMINL